MGGRGATYSLTGAGGGDSARTIASKNKLARLESELNERMQEYFVTAKRRQGQPWHTDKAKGRSEQNAFNRNAQRIQTLQKEVETQRKIVERQIARDVAKGSLFDYKGNLNITERNHKQVKAFLKDINAGKVKSGRSRATEKAWERRLANFEKGLKQSKGVKIVSSAQRLIDSGQVTQWAKNPNVYFIKGLKKTALEMKPDGTFSRSMRFTGPLTKEFGDKIERFIRTGKGEW